MQLLEGEVAIVTGGTAGIGKAIAQSFIRAGAAVAIVGTNRERGEGVLAELLKENPFAKALFIPGDVAQVETANAVVQEVLSKWGKIDILVNNAGITRDQLLLKMEGEDWDRVLDVNVKSCYYFAKAVTRPMMKARKGAIINMSSVVGIRGNAGQVSYSASKAAVIGFTKALAKELASRNIRVNCIAPGAIRSDMTDKLSEEHKKAFLELIPMERFGEPAEVASVALFLASGKFSSYVTAQVVTVDGGFI